MPVSARSSMRAFPGSRTPSIVQLVRWAFTQHEFWNRQSAMHGPVFRVRFSALAKRVVCFTTPTAARAVLRLKPSVSHAGEAYKILEQSAGPHAVILLDEDEHLRMRKLILSPLHGERLARWESFCEQRTLEDVLTWPVGEQIRLRPITERISMAVILKIVFGVRDPARAEELRRLLPVLFALPLGAAPGFVFRAARLDLGPRSPWGAFRRKRDRIDGLILAEVAERRAEFAQNQGQGDGEDRADLLSMLLAARDDDGNPMSDRELRDQLVTMLVAGHETTSTSIAWAIERLLRTPDVLATLLARLEEGDTTYLDAVIKETMRIRPVVAQIGRMIKEETEIDGWTVPADTMIIVPITVMHKDPEVYPQPEEFRPERFLDGNDPGGYSWMPFGGGVRRCPGASLALLEMRVVLRTILQHVELAPDRLEPEPPTVRGITIVPGRGGHVRVVRRLQPAPSAVAA